MRFTEGIDLLKRAGRKAADVAIDVAMAQPAISSRVGRVQAQVERLRHEVELLAAEAEARAQVLLRELQEEAIRQRKRMDRVRSASDRYQTLGLQNGASLDDVKKAYRRLMRQHHPDKHSTDARAEAEAHARAQEINEAYRELTALLTGRDNRASAG